MSDDAAEIDVFSAVEARRTSTLDYRKNRGVFVRVIAAQIGQNCFRDNMRRIQEHCHQRRGASKAGNRGTRG